MFHYFLFTFFYFNYFLILNFLLSRLYLQTHLKSCIARAFKPSAEQIKLAANILDIATEKCALVEHMHTDIEATKQANSLSVLVDTGIFNDEVKSHNPNLIISSVAELPIWLDVIYDIIKNRTSIETP